jgi:hypothetical protein
VEYSYNYAKGRFSDDRPRCSKQIIWFSKAGIDALQKAGWTIEGVERDGAA